MICSGTIYRHNLFLLKPDCNWHIITEFITVTVQFYFDSIFQTTSRLTDCPPSCQHLSLPHKFKIIFKLDDARADGKNTIILAQPYESKFDYYHKLK